MHAEGGAGACWMSIKEAQQGGSVLAVSLDVTSSDTPVNDGPASPRDRQEITAITARGVLNDFDYSITFESASDSDRMRVIYAPNGRGKTNLLRGVNFLLTPSVDALQALIDVPVRALSVSFASGATISMEKETAFAGSFTVAVAQGGAEAPLRITVDPTDFAGRLYKRAWAERADYAEYVETVRGVTRGAILIGDDRLSPHTAEVRDPGRPEDIYAAGRRRAGDVVTTLLERVERMLTRTAFAGLSRERSHTGVYVDITRATLAGNRNLTPAQARSRLEQQIRSLLETGQGLETYELMSLRQVRDIRTQLVQARANSRYLPSLYAILKPYLDSLDDQVASLTAAQQLIDTFVTGVNRFLDRKEMRFSASTGISLRSGTGQRLDPEGLSSGEKHLLYLLATAVLATADNPLVIIDEPEISLGLEWQRGLLAELRRCTSATGVQFLVASHSVQVMGDVEHIVSPVEA